MSNQPDDRNASRKRKISPEFSEDIFKKPKKPSACRVCHLRKVKCSGESPCTNCVKGDCAADCTYPERDQKITVKQSYITRLIAENDELRQRHASEAQPIQNSISVDQDVTDSDSSLRNPLLGDGSWFVPLNTNGMPIHISEAADAAFATRFRQALSDSPNVAHIPRMHYISDSKLASMELEDCHWPGQARARLLIKIAVNGIERRYRFLHENVILGSLKQYFQSSESVSSIAICRLWALFAVGEVYSSRINAPVKDHFPGLHYFAKATRQLRFAQERPQSDVVEVLMLLALYSLFINRRHNAYMLATNAVRTCMIMGLNQDIPKSQLLDPALRSNVKQLWWSAYIFERMIASSLGQPPSVQDEDIEVDLISSQSHDDVWTESDFDADYVNATVRLARLFQSVISSIYSRRIVREAFSLRVQQALRQLRGWVESLPKGLRLEPDEKQPSGSRHVKSVHLAFNQCMILATRPVLLHIFRSHKDLWREPRINLGKELSETPLALAQACIRCARHSIRMLTALWIDGSLAIFDHFDTLYLFSAATVLAISTISIGRHNEADQEAYEAAREFLLQLKENGDFAAHECCLHLDRMEPYMARYREQPARNSNSESLAVCDLPTQEGIPNAIFAQRNAPIMTAGMVLSEPSMQDFLSQANLDLGFLDTQMEFNQFQSLYWPTIPDISSE